MSILKISFGCGCFMGLSLNFGLSTSYFTLLPLFFCKENNFSCPLLSFQTFNNLFSLEIYATFPKSTSRRIMDRVLLFYFLCLSPLTQILSAHKMRHLVFIWKCLSHVRDSNDWASSHNLFLPFFENIGERKASHLLLKV